MRAWTDLAATQDRMAGAAFTASEAAADCRQLCEQLAAPLHARRQATAYDTEVLGSERQGRRRRRLAAHEPASDRAITSLASGWKTGHAPAGACAFRLSAQGLQHHAWT